MNAGPIVAPMRHARLAAMKMSSVCVVMALAVGPISAQNLEPSTADRDAARGVIDLIEKQHLLRREFGPEFASQAADGYIAVLDPNKQFFLQADIAEFSRRKPGLAADLKRGDLGYAFDVFARYQQRVREAEAVWKDLIRPDAVNFAADDVLVVDPKAADYPKDAAVAREQWRLWVKYALLQMKTDPAAKGFDLKAACDDLSTQYARHARWARLVKSHEVAEWFLGQVGGCYDTGTAYTSAASQDRHRENLRGSFVGVGMTWNNGEVMSVLPGGPAAKDGRLKTGDRVVAVGQGESGPTADITRLTSDEAIALVRGPIDTVVRLVVKRPGEAQPRTIALRRGKVYAETAKVEARVETVDGVTVGYLDVPNFYRGEQDDDRTTAAVRRHLNGFKTAGVGGVVLDLRRCSGGHISEALGLAGLFIGPGAALQVKDTNGTVTTYPTGADSLAWDKAVVVLTGPGTAAGAEIVCAAVQDYRRGLVVGDGPTNGHGLMRGEMDVGRHVNPTNPPTLGILMVATAQLYRVTGEGFQQRGLTPDVIIPSLDGARAATRTRSTGNFGFDRVPSLPVPNQGMVESDVVGKVRSMSADRRARVAEFARLQTLIDWELTRVARKVETLTETAFRARRAEEAAADLPKAKPGESDFYLREVLAVAAGYAQETKGRTAAPAVVAARIPVPAADDAASVRARDRDAARQAVTRLEEDLRVAGNKVIAAQVALLAAKTAYDRAEAGSPQEFVAGLAAIAAAETVNNLSRDKAQIESDLRRAKSRLDALRE